MSAVTEFRQRPKVATKMGRTVKPSAKAGDALVYRGVRLSHPPARSTRSTELIKAAVKSAVAKHQTALASGAD